MNIAKAILILVSVFIAVSAESSIASPANPDKCEAAGEFLILKNQKYALCALASCLTFNQVAYCGCDLLKGDSISLPFDFGDGENVCTVNEEGPGNGYRVSTYSVPEQATYQAAISPRTHVPANTTKINTAAFRLLKGLTPSVTAGYALSAPKAIISQPLGSWGKKSSFARAR